MSTTVKRVQANQQNALNSTGPKSDAGKAAVAGNALKHGIFSGHLILGDESRDEYHSLLQGLCHSLRPAGVLELSLVEKVAINLWRQRRLVKAEQADTELNRHARQIADQVSDQLGVSTYSPRRITVDDLNGIDMDQITWCEAVIQECEQLSPDASQDWTQLREQAPRIHEQLVKDAEADEMTVEDYLEEHDDGLSEYLDELVRYCREQLEKVDQLPVVHAIAELVRAQRSIPSALVRDKLARYQTMLDNDLYKALKALREAQQWRRETIEIESDEAGTIAASVNG
jgi:hypothetical protein